MKSILKFLILCLGLLVAQGVMAVTLPSQSYSPYVIDSSELGVDPYIGGGVAMPTQSYSALRAGESEWGKRCIQTSFRDLTTCQNCCKDLLEKVCPNPETCTTDYLILYNSCANDCGRSLPLEGGMYILLALAVAFGAAKAVSTTAQQRLKLSV